MSEFVPSEQQQAILDAVLTTSDNLAISALAGCGKSSSLVWIAKHLPKADTKIFCAFNADIVKELQAKLDGTGVSARTFHSLGLSALKKYLNVKDLAPKDTKYRDLVNKWAEADGVFSLELAQAIQDYPEDERGDKFYMLRKDTLDLFVALLNLVRVKLVAWDDVAHITQLVRLNRLDIDVPHANLVDMVIHNIEYIMKQAEAETRKQVIDFTDMIYWAVRWNLRLYPHKWVLVDEAQDFNPMQREMIAKIIDPNGGRIILVGDPNQAIYAFAGADSDSFDLSVNRWHCTVLPLTVTRRCASVITQHASRLVPDFTCPPDKPRGKVVYLQEADFAAHIQLGDMVVCRVQSPLVKYCLQLIAKGIPSVIKGKDLSKSFLALLEKLTKRKDYAFADLLNCLTKHEAEQVELAMKKGDEGVVEAIHDQCSGLRFVIEAYPDVPSIDALEVKIKNLFGDNKPHDDVVTFCTVHKSKGLEADRVFILAPDKLPLSFEGITSEQLQQEYNLLYVAETRAKHVLVIVVNAKFAKYNPMPPYAQEDFEDKVWDADATPVETPELTAVAETVTEEPDFASAITAQLTALPSGIGLFAVDGDDKMFVARHIIAKGKFFVETINGDYIQETLSLDDALAKMEAFSPFIPLWNEVSAKDWGFATSKPKTVAERRAEKLAEMKVDATPEPVVTVPDAPPPFAKTIHQRLNDLNGDYDPDTGLSADGETTTMYITTDLQNNFVVYERDYADQDDVKWSRDYTTKDIVTLISKMQAINSDVTAWQTVTWGDWIEMVHEDETEAKSADMEALKQEATDAIREMAIQMGGVIAGETNTVSLGDQTYAVVPLNEPETPIADALTISKIAEIIRSQGLASIGEAMELATKIHQTVAPLLTFIDWTASNRATVKVAIKRILRETNYILEHGIEIMADKVADFYQKGAIETPSEDTTLITKANEAGAVVDEKLGLNEDKTPTFEAVMKPRICELVAGSREGLFALNTQKSVFVTIGADESTVIYEHTYATDETRGYPTEIEKVLFVMQNTQSDPALWEEAVLDDWYIITRQARPTDTPVEAESTDTTPADAPTFSNGESAPTYTNGKDHSATTTQTVTPPPAPKPTLPLPSTATDTLRALVDQFRAFELVELDLVQQAIEHVRREKTEGVNA